MTLIRPQSGQRIPRGWFGQLYDEVMACRIRGDQRTISVKRTPSGTVVSMIGAAKGGTGAAVGMFTILSTGEGKFIVVDTNNQSQAGIAQINGRFYPCPKYEFTPQETVYIFLRYMLPTQDKADPGDTVDFIESKELLQPDETFAYGLIGRIVFTGDQPVIAQDHAPGTLTVWWQGPCWET